MPGAYLPPAYPGYTRREAIAAVGPGWEELAGRAWDAVTAARGRVSQVKQKFARLTVYWDGIMRSIPADERVRAEIEALGDESEQTCEACGRAGRRWPAADDERVELRDAGPAAARVSTLCERCGWRFYYDGAQGWADIRGDWMVGSDDGVHDDDDDPPEPWRGKPDEGGSI